MVVVALLLIALISLGGAVYELSDGARLSVGRGSYRVEVGGSWKAYLWLPEGLYNVTVRTLNLKGGLTGVIVILANTSIGVREVLMVENPFVRGGFNLKANITLVNVADCTPTNITFWRGAYLGSLTMLRHAVNWRGLDGVCVINVDTMRGVGTASFLYVTPDHWVTMTITGSDYVIALVYGVLGGRVVDNNITVSPGGRDGPGTVLPETPIPFEAFKGGFYSGSRVSYGVLLGLLLALILVVVVEHVSARRGD
jgi:hypothetical protein